MIDSPVVTQPDTAWFFFNATAACDWHVQFTQLPALPSLSFHIYEGSDPPLDPSGPYVRCIDVPLGVNLNTKSFFLHVKPIIFATEGIKYTVTCAGQLDNPWGDITRALSIPGCSVCGYSVEFLRSCYVGRWRLFRDNPAELKGRYYFSHIGTPAYPGFHLLGSQTWNDKNLLTEVPLGEVPGKTEWYNGSAPVTRIPPRRIGDVNCIQLGEAYANRLPLDLITDGVPTSCFDRLNRPTSPGAFLLDVANCVTQRFYASVISLMYDDDVAEIQSRFDAIFGDVPYQFFRRAANDLRPQMIVVISGNLAILVCDGTRDFQQFALQAAGSLQGPTSFGAFSTMPFWYASATVALEFMTESGVDDGHQVVSVGHSYGAAVCAIANARLLASDRGSVPRLLVFGIPKPGDARLVHRLNFPESIFLQDDDDLVAILPLDLAALGPLLGTIGFLVVASWPSWAAPIGPIVLDHDGAVVNRAATTQGTSTLLAMVEDIINDVATFPITGHFIQEYARRLALRCPGDVP